MKAYGGWLRLASHLHMPLNECLERITQREYSVWDMWLDEQLSEPGKTDRYIMQLTLFVNNLLRKTFKGKTDDYKITYEKRGLKPEPMSEEEIKQASAASKSKWKSLLGMK